ncbi:caspase family protein [Streptomyces sp. NBC_01214]|uniref:caspase, EACC1-associated type n=1 Tax=Streptomyces sp. NBC_01214 TaxID=2903777 RepID=UPI0022520F5F|nr:caspase family protein [Streptomyces sp. NBC_01214]MCX4808392.1 caspase family protein [Streptomyces sp. NBC_01214]
MPVPDPTASRAVLIGVDGYAHPDLEQLPAAAAGARRLAELLRDPSVWGLPAAHVTVLGTDAPVSRILGAVRDAALEATETLLVYFAGHGLRDRDEKLYLALAEADADHPQIGTLQYRTLRDVVRQAGYRARHRVTVLDCCYSGLAGAMSGAEVPTRVDLAHALDETAHPDGHRADGWEAADGDDHGDCVLTSAPATRRSFVPPGAPFPEFTGELISLLEHGLAGAGAELSLEDAWRAVRRRMYRRGSAEPQQFAQNAVATRIRLRNRAAGPATAVPLPFENGPLAVVDVEDGTVRAYCAGGRVLYSPATTLDELLEWTLTRAGLGAPRLHRHGREADPLLALTRAAAERFGLPRSPGGGSRGTLPDGHRVLARLRRAGGLAADPDRLRSLGPAVPPRRGRPVAVRTAVRTALGRARPPPLGRHRAAPARRDRPRARHLRRARHHPERLSRNHGAVPDDRAAPADPFDEGQTDRGPGVHSQPRGPHGCGGLRAVRGPGRAPRARGPIPAFPPAHPCSGADGGGALLVAAADRRRAPRVPRGRHQGEPGTGRGGESA